MFIQLWLTHPFQTLFKRHRALTTRLYTDLFHTWQWKALIVIIRGLNPLPSLKKSYQFLWIFNWASAWDFQQFDILTSVDSDEPLQPPVKLRYSEWFSVSSLTIIEYSSDQQRLWSDCAYAQAGLRLCWSHIPHCWKSHALAHYWLFCEQSFIKTIRGLLIIQAHEC